MEWVAETHRNMCIIMCVLRHSGDCGRDKMASSTEEDEEERPAYRRISSNPSGRILLKDDQNILPAAEMPELTIRTSECSHQSYSAFRRSIFFFGAMSSWMVFTVSLTMKPHPDWSLVAEPSVYTMISCGLLFCFYLFCLFERET